MNRLFPALLLAAVSAALCTAAAADKPRARDLGIPFDGTPAAHNAITDVAGVAVGYSTLIAGTGAHAIRTGVTAILPRGKTDADQALQKILQKSGRYPGRASR